MVEQDPGSTYPTAEKPRRCQETASTAKARHPCLPQLGTGQGAGWPEWETDAGTVGNSREPHLSQLSVPRADRKPTVSGEWWEHFPLSLFLAPTSRHGGWRFSFYGVLCLAGAGMGKVPCLLHEAG